MADLPDFYAAINFSGQSIAVAPPTEWDIEEGVDVLVTGSGTVAAGGVALILDYTVPAGKLVKVDYWGSGMDQVGRHELRKDLATLFRVNRLANDGFLSGFPAPVRFDAGETLSLYVRNDGAGTGAFTASIGFRVLDA